MRVGKARGLTLNISHLKIISTRKAVTRQIFIFVKSEILIQTDHANLLKYRKNGCLVRPTCYNKNTVFIPGKTTGLRLDFLSVTLTQIYTAISRQIFKILRWHFHICKEYEKMF